ncbi:MAG: hypothetical protein NUK62_08705 [Tenericutes bacterium]|nr:hypothetical protein [Mycoplasmatota bacterium]
MEKSVNMCQINVFDNIDIPFLLKSNREFTIFWKVVEHYKKQVDLLSPEILQYCEKEVIHKLFNNGDHCLSIVLDKCLKQVVNYLKNTEKRFRLGAYLYKPSEVPEFEGITILVNVGINSFTERVSIWDEIEGILTTIIDEMKKAHPEHIEQIQNANNLIGTSIQKL